MTILKPPPPALTEKKLLLSKFAITFAPFVISHELGVIYFDMSFFFFSLLEDERYSVFFMSFMSLRKPIMFRQCFSFEIYT